MTETTTDQVAREITPNVDKSVDMKPAIFRFKKDDLGNKRANVEVKLPIPSVEGVVNILEKGGKELELLLDSLYDVVRGIAQDYVSNDENITDEPSFAPFISKVTWEAIANMERQDRRGTSIPEEQWKAFAAAYISVMPALTSKSKDAVTAAAGVFLKKFAMFKTDKKVLEKLKGQLAIFAEQKEAEDFGDILELLLKRADTYLKADDVAALAAAL
jgi:predicted house-cleaning noncanonical NTP pyrophosphatase (MazG superfamily)